MEVRAVDDRLTVRGKKNQREYLNTDGHTQMEMNGVVLFNN